MRKTIALVRSWPLLCTLVAAAWFAGCGAPDDKAEDIVAPPATASSELVLNSDLGSVTGAPVASSNTCGAANNHTPTCATSNAPERSYLWTAPASGSYTFTTHGSSFDTILQLRDKSSNNSLGCNDDSSGTTQSSVTATLSAGQRVIIVVDGWSSYCGSFNLNIRGPRIPNAPWVWSYWSLQSYNYPQHYVRHRNWLGYIDTIWSSLDRHDATFRIVPGLADPGCVSFESRNYPGHYLRHAYYRIWLNVDNGSDLFKQDATFCMRPGLANSSDISFESFNYPGLYMRHANYELWITTDTGGVYRSDATFRIVSPWAP